MSRLWTTLTSVLTLWGAVRGVGKQCPDLAANPSCHCYNFENGMYLECPAATVHTLKMLLEVIQSPVQSLSIYEPDKTLTKLPKNLFSDSTIIRKIHISQSNIEDLHEDSLLPLKPYLESFSLVSARLKEIPQNAFKGLNRLNALDLQDNQITAIPDYTFYGLRLEKLSLKRNRLQNTTDYSFAGLEATISELDISGNELHDFPMNALKRLEQLQQLRLAVNQISAITSDSYSHLNSLINLDLSFNRFRRINRETFKVCLALRTLSLFNNEIEVIHAQTFIMLRDLESLDLSHNRIGYLDSMTFRHNKKIRSVDLSHNHLHYVGGLFAFLPDLKEVFLTENNILQVLRDTFTDSMNISVIYMQANSITRIDDDTFFTLTNLTQLHMGSNFISHLPASIFANNSNLTSLSLDGNQLNELEPGTFEKTIALREIRLHNNRLGTVHKRVFDPLPNLLELHLQHNEISSVDEGAFRTLQNLAHINLQANSIAMLGDVFPPNSTSLVSLQLDDNAIASLHSGVFKGQSNSQIVWLGHNRLARIERPLFRDLEAVQKIYLNNNSISFIEDGAFAALTALKHLDLSNNRLRRVKADTFAELAELDELDLSHNGIEEIESDALMHLKKLESLALAFNPLKVLNNSIFQKGLPIRVLSLVNCSISQIEPNAFVGLNNLNELSLASNELSVRDLRHLNIPGLRVLKLSLNNLSNLDDRALNGLPSLQELTLHNCSIRKLPAGVFAKNKNIIKLDLSANSLSALYSSIFLQLNILQELNLNDNKFIQIPHIALSNISTMETLALARNNFVTLEVYHLNGMPNLRHLDLSRNSISGLTGFSSTNLSQLVSVNLSKNRLATIPANFFHKSPLLKWLDLSENRFHHVPNAALSEITLPGLGWLNVSGNPIVNMHDNGPVRSYPALEEMHLQHSELIVITSKEFELFPSLLHAHLSYNNILKISPGAFSSLTQLISLDLGVNQIEIIPQERLYGLNSIRVLNVTKNLLSELDDFPKNMPSLQVLDVSFNRLTSIKKTTFNYLYSLTELYLQGNAISVVAGDAFRLLKELKVLDLNRNHFEQIPLEAFKPLEAQIQSIRTDGNPLICNCNSEELWEWFKDHRKQMDQSGDKVLKCDQPAELHGRVFVELEPKQICNQPVVVKLGIQDIQPFSVVVSWQSRNHSGVHGFQVAYYSVDSMNEVRGKILSQSTRSLKLTSLYPGIKYRICVLALGNWVTSQSKTTSRLIMRKTSQENSTNDEFDSLHNGILPFLVDTATTRCTEVLTLGAPDLSVLQDHSMGVQSILTRRLGLIVGCCLGFVVFVFLISILGYLKVKKERRCLKRDQPAVPPEYMSYRHFSIQSGELAERSGHPHFISDINTTTLN